MDLPKLEEFKSLLEETLEEEDKIIGKYYFILKNYKTEIFIFYAKLKNIKKNVGITYKNAIVDKYYFEDYQKIYKIHNIINNNEIYYENIEINSINIPIDTPYTSYRPENLHKDILFSTKFYERKKINKYLQEEIILFSFNKIKKKLILKSNIPNDIFNYEIKSFIYNN